MGGFKDTPIDDLVVAVLKETLKRTGVKPEASTGGSRGGVPASMWKGGSERDAQVHGSAARGGWGGWVVWLERCLCEAFPSALLHGATPLLPHWRPANPACTAARSGSGLLCHLTAA